MTLEEYKKETATAIRKTLQQEDQKEVEKLIELLQKDIEKSFYSAEKSTKLLGADQYSPSGYAYGIYMMWEGSAQETIDCYDLG